MVLCFFKFYFRNILILLPSACASPSNGHIVRFLQTVTYILTSAFYWKEYRHVRPLQNDECQILLQKHSNSIVICSSARASPSNGYIVRFLQTVIDNLTYDFYWKEYPRARPLQNDE